MKALRADHPWHLVLGLTVWAVWFCAVYGALSVACSVRPPAPDDGPFNGVNGALVAATVVTAALLAAAAWGCARGRGGLPAGDAGDAGRFIAGTSAWLYAVASFSTVFVGLPLLVLTPCV